MGNSSKQFGKTQAVIEKYRPSNASEGEWFMSQFCENCRRDSESNPCAILCKTMMCIICEDGSDDYPTEWRYVDDKPVCTKFSDKHKPRNIPLAKSKATLNQIEMFPLEARP